MPAILLLSNTYVYFTMEVDNKTKHNESDKLKDRKIRQKD